MVGSCESSYKISAFRKVLETFSGTEKQLLAFRRNVLVNFVCQLVSYSLSQSVSQAVVCSGNLLLGIRQFNPLKTKRRPLYLKT